MDKLEWYEKVEEYINENLTSFYEEFYGVSELKKIGTSYRINPCPVCGHSNCCTLTGNTVHCFSGSCNWKGTHITAWYMYAGDKLGLSVYEAVAKLEKFTSYKFPAGTPEEIEAYEKHQKTQAILRIAEDFYHNQLMECDVPFSLENGSRYTPIDYMKIIRKRSVNTLKQFKVGFSYNYFELFNTLLAEGYSKEEIKEAKVWVPEGVFVFFYRHPITKDIVRLNTKNPFKARFSTKDEFGNKVDGDIVVGFSTGNKFLYFPPNFSFKEDVIIVEGEHDLFAVWEAGYTNVVAVGGQIEREYQLSILNKLKDTATIYCFFDNDEAGDKYVLAVNEYFADRPVSKIKYNEEFKDPDEYFTINAADKTIFELINSAEKLVTDKFKINRVGNLWSIATREKKLEFTMRGKNDKGTFKGSATYYINGILNDRDDDIPLVKCKAKIKPLNFHLYDYMESYFNSDIEKKNLDELIAIYTMSSKKEEITKVIAEKIYNSHNDEDLINEIKVGFKQHTSDWSNIVDNILKEVNDIQNKSSNVSLTNIPKMRVGQYFNVRNNDAYMYFTYVKIDGDVKRKLPFLLRNDGTLIRLDLLKRKDSQCLLLIDNKYELPFEINDAILELNECCLTQEWVEKFVENKISDEELEPSLLIKEIERYIRKFYYTNDNNVYKIVSLYIYTTYYYELFAQIPYLFLNGSKGSGKSILDECIKLLSFNAKMALDITEAALFRTLSVEGGVLILDEQENLNSKNRTMDNSMAAILKGGYARSGAVYRCNTEKGGIVEKYTVYGPKVISNIMGMDDVIEDRCIIINTYPLKLTKETKMEDPKHYAEERLDEIRELTSKCALSALRNFRKLYEIYDGSLFETGNARLSQILTPIQAVATLVDLKEVEELRRANPELEGITGEYEKSLMNYWNSTLKALKENIEKDTPEGIIKRSVQVIARELYGLVPPKDIEFIDSSNHKYNEPIKHDKEEGWFEVNVLHFKCFIEEIKPGETAYTRYIPRWIKTVFKLDPNDIKRKTVHVENEELMKEFKGNAKPKVNVYRFYFKDFINMEESFFSESESSNDKKEQALF